MYPSLPETSQSGAATIAHLRKHLPSLSQNDEMSATKHAQVYGIV